MPGGLADCPAGPPTPITVGQRPEVGPRLDAVNHVNNINYLAGAGWATARFSVRRFGNSMFYNTK